LGIVRGICHDDCRGGRRGGLRSAVGARSTG
jgi:hypothetical protein